MIHHLKHYSHAQVGMILVRIILGSIFVIHGAQKVLGLFGGPGLEGFVQWAATVGIPSWLAYAAAIAEFVGGILLILGIATEIALVAVIAVMAGAIYYVHRDHGYFIQNGGFEYPLNLIFLSIAVMLGGCGAGELWCPFRRNHNHK